MSTTISRERILTTHVGSLPRSQAVTDAVFAHEREEPLPDAEATIDAAVDAVVARQVQAGVDLVSDGEMSKISYATASPALPATATGSRPQTLRHSPAFSSAKPPLEAPRPTGARAASGTSASRTAVP